MNRVEEQLRSRISMVEAQRLKGSRGDALFSVQIWLRG